MSLLAGPRTLAPPIKLTNGVGRIGIGRGLPMPAGIDGPAEGEVT